MAKSITLQEIVAEAEEVGAARRSYAADWRNFHLTATAWLAACRELAGVQTDDELAALVERVRGEGRLWSLCVRVSEGWSRVLTNDGRPPIDKPGPHGAFADPTGDETGPLIERKLLGLSIAQASAAAGWIAADNRPAGRASSLQEPAERLAEFNRQLETLKTAELSGLFRLADIHAVAGRGYVLDGSSLVDQAAARGAADPAAAPIPYDNRLAVLRERGWDHMVSIVEDGMRRAGMPVAA